MQQQEAGAFDSNHLNHHVPKSIPMRIKVTRLGNYTTSYTYLNFFTDSLIQLDIVAWRDKVASVRDKVICMHGDDKSTVTLEWPLTQIGRDGKYIIPRTIHSVHSGTRGKVHLIKLESYWRSGF
jgi:hypothetical protein